MGIPFKMEFESGIWAAFKTNGQPIEPEDPPSNPSTLETVDIHKRADGTRYVKIVGTSKCYDIVQAGPGKNPHFFMVDDNEWLACRGNNANSASPIDPCPNPEADIEQTFMIEEGSQWVNIGGRWYKIG